MSHSVNEMEQGPRSIVRKTLIPVKATDSVHPVLRRPPTFDRYQCTACDLIWVVSDESMSLTMELDVSRHLQVGHTVWLQLAGEEMPFVVEGSVKQPRERAVACQRCRRATWQNSAICETCQAETLPAK